MTLPLAIKNARRPPSHEAPRIGIFNPTLSAETAAHQKLFAGEPRGIVRRQKDGDRSNVADLPDAAQRRLPDDGLLEVRSKDAGADNAFGHDHAGVQRVNPDLPRP